MFQHNPDEFLRRFITVDETWIHYFTPETKEQSKQWTSPVNQLEDREVGRKCDGNSFLGCTRFNSYPSVEANDQNAALLDRFNNILKKKHPYLPKKKMLFHQDNARVHTGTDGQIQQIPLRIASPFSIFARFRPLRLFPVSKPTEMFWRKEIHHQ